MGNLIQTATSYWEDTVGYPADAKLLYKYAFESQQSFGQTGIGCASDPLVCFLTGLDQGRLDAARKFLIDRAKLDWRGKWWFAVERMDHVLRTRDGKWSPNNTQGARDFVRKNELPVWVIEHIRERYPDLFADDEFDRLIEVNAVRQAQGGEGASGLDGSGCEGGAIGDRRGIGGGSGDEIPPHTPPCSEDRKPKTD